MEATPTVPNPKIPASQQEAQDTVLRLLQETANVLPPGTSLDGSRYRIGKMDRSCEDNPAGPDSPVHIEDWRDVKLPPGTDFDTVIAQTGDIWTQWGWQVVEREGFEKPETDSATRLRAMCSIWKPETMLARGHCLSGLLPAIRAVCAPILHAIRR